MKDSKVLLLLALCWAATLPLRGQLLWEISGNGLREKSYILATDPLCNMTYLDSVPNLFPALGRCRTMVTEMAADSSDMRNLLLQSALLPDSVPLASFYSAADYQAIDHALLSAVQLSVHQLEALKPAYITELYRMALFRQQLHYDEGQTMEAFFQAIALQRGMKMVGLDNAAESVYMLFDREPLAWQAKELLRVVTYPEREVEQARRLLQYYKQGSLNEIAYQVAMPDNQSSVNYSDYQVFCRRNTEWVKRLAQPMKDGSCFVVLDAIYLGGDDGLLAQLRRAGYKVKPKSVIRPHAG